MRRSMQQPGGKTRTNVSAREWADDGKARARNTTIGVYTLAKRVMKFSERDLWSLAFSTSPGSSRPWSLRTTCPREPRMTPERLTQPEMTLSVTEASRVALARERDGVQVGRAFGRWVPSRGKSRR